MPAPALLELMAAYPATAAAWTPASLPGLVAWYDASNSGSITQSGGAVSQWNDLSGSGFHVVQATGSKQPTTGATTLNGLNVLDFVRANAQVLSKTSISTTVTSVFAVALNSSVPGTSVPFATNAATFFYIQTGTPFLSMYAGGGGMTTSNNTTVGTAFTVYGIVNGGSSVLNLNGTTSVPGTNPGSTTAATALHLGNDTGTNYLNGSIAEVFVSSSVITGGDITSARTYLTGKWGTP